MLEERLLFLVPSYWSLYCHQLDFAKCDQFPVTCSAFKLLLTGERKHLFISKQANTQSGCLFTRFAAFNPKLNSVLLEAGGTLFIFCDKGGNGPRGVVHCKSFKVPVTNFQSRLCNLQIK